MDRVRTALIGCGKVGQIHAQALAVAARVGVRRGLRCRRRARRGVRRRSTAARPFTDVAAMLARRRRPRRS